VAAMMESRSEVDLLIQHGVTIPVDGVQSIIHDGAVAIDCGRIVAVGPAQEICDAYTGRRTIDARHCAVLPGLIDTHHHCLQNFLKGSRDDLPFPVWIQQVSAPLIRLAVDEYREGHSELQRHATRLGCIEALKSGITTILNMEWATHPDVIDVYEETGIRAVHTLTLTDVDHWQRAGMLLPMAEAWEPNRPALAALSQFGRWAGHVPLWAGLRELGQRGATVRGARAGRGNGGRDSHPHGREQVGLGQY